jgi:hypothetical protein
LGGVTGFLDQDLNLRPQLHICWNPIFYVSHNGYWKCYIEIFTLMKHVLDRNNLSSNYSEHTITLKFLRMEDAVGTLCRKIM